MIRKLLKLWDEFITYQIMHRYKNTYFNSEEEARLIVGEEAKLNDFMEWLRQKGKYKKNKIV